MNEHTRNAAIGVATIEAAKSAACKEPRRMTPRELIEALPETFRVGGFDWRIEKWSAASAMDTRRWGECSPAFQTIRVMLDMPTPHKAVDTLLHEMMHAIYWAYAIDDKDDEERTVSMMASAWLQIYRDNPWLLTWIQRALAQ